MEKENKCHRCGDSLGGFVTLNCGSNEVAYCKKCQVIREKGKAIIVHRMPVGFRQRRW